MAYKGNLPFPVQVGAGVSNFFKGAPVTAAATLVPTGNFFRVDGSTTITAIDGTGIGAGAVITIFFTNAVVVQHSTSLQLFAGVNFNANPGDRLTLGYDGANWLELSRMTAAGATGAISFQVMGGRNQSVSTVYADNPSQVAMNLVPFILPYNSYLETMMLSTQAAATWTAEIRVNLVLKTGATLASGGAVSAYSSAYSGVAMFNAGDRVSLYINGTSVNRPYIWALFRRA